jgi:Sulfotransferase family
MARTTDRAEAPRISVAGRGGAPILVTGMARCGTSWVGKVLAASGRLTYVNEPLNPHHPPGRSPGVLRASVRHRYQYITEDNEHEFLHAFRDTVALRYHPLAEVRRNHTAYDLVRLAKYWSSFTAGRLLRRRALLDDPFAALSAEWFARRLGCDVVVLVRHPAALFASRKRLGWKPFGFQNLLSQPLLLRDWLEPLEQQMRAADHPRVLLESTSLLWRIIYHVAAELEGTVPRVQTVRYEDLASDPSGEFEALSGSLGIPFTDASRRFVLRSSTGRSRERSHSWSLARGGVGKSAYRPLDSRANAWRWRQELSDDELARVRELTGEVGALFYPDADWETSR